MHKSTGLLPKRFQIYSHSKHFSLLSDLGVGKKQTFIHVVLAVCFIFCVFFDQLLI